jgi:hypothetical protein
MQEIDRTASTETTVVGLRSAAAAVLAREEVGTVRATWDRQETGIAFETATGSVPEDG